MKENPLFYALWERKEKKKNQLFAKDKKGKEMTGTRTSFFKRPKKKPKTYYHFKLWDGDLFL